MSTGNTVPTDLLASQPLPTSVSSVITRSISFIEHNGWYILLLSVITYYLYYHTTKAQYTAEINNIDRNQALQERMREQRLKQQSTWLHNSKSIVEQTKLNKQLQQIQIDNNRRNRHGKHTDGDSDDDNEMIDMLGSAIAAKGGLINGKKVLSDKKSGFSTAAFNSKATNSGAGKKFGGTRFTPKSK